MADPLEPYMALIAISSHTGSINSGQWISSISFHYQCKQNVYFKASVVS